MSNEPLILVLIGLAIFVVGASLMWASSLRNRIGSVTSLLREKEQLLYESENLRSASSLEKAKLEGQVAQISAQKECIEKLEAEKNALDTALREAAGVSEGLRVEIKMVQEASEEKIALLRGMETSFKEYFQQTANAALDQTGQKFSEQNKVALSQLIAPLKEKLEQFDQRIVESRTIEAQSQQKILTELENVSKVGMSLSDQASSLASALKSEVKTQGDWGELILETLLERSGLEKDREYFVQQTDYNAEGQRVRPDVYVKLPGDRLVVIDSKVSIAAYIRAMEAASDEDKDQALKEHVRSIRAHIQGLGKKSYHTIDGGEALDTVLMFVSHEVALTVATSRDPKLFELAMDRHIVLVSPNTLMLALKQVHGLWRIHKQNKYAEEIAKQAGLLVDKFTGFIGDLEKVGKRIDQARASYDGAFNKLSLGSGNIVGRVKRLVDLGARNTKQLPATGSEPESVAEESIGLAQDR